MRIQEVRYMNQAKDPQIEGMSHLTEAKFVMKQMDKEREESKKVTGYTEYIKAFEKKQILYGKVGSLYEDHEKKEIIILVGISEIPEIMIPFKEIFRDYPIQKYESDEERLKRERQMGSKLIGAEVPFILTGISKDEKDHLSVTASRRMALQILEHRNYFRISGREYNKLAEGNKLLADIISVGVNAIMVNVAGVDTQMSKWRLSFKPLGDLTFAPVLDGVRLVPGGKLPVAIKKLTYNSNGKVELSACHKEVELENSRKSEAVLREGTLCFGIVSSVFKRENNTYRLYMWLDSYDLPAFADFTPGSLMYQPVQFGASVKLSVITRTRKGFVRCKVISVSPAGPYSPYF